MNPPSFAESPLPPVRTRRVPRRTYVLVAVAALAIAAAAWLDRPVARAVRDSGLADSVNGRCSPLAQVIKFPGTYYFTMIVAIPFGLLHTARWKASALLLLSGIAGLLNALLKWIIGRPRPYLSLDPSGQPAPFSFDPFHNGLAGLLHRETLAFPSGHSCTAFAMAMAAAILLPRCKWAFYVIAALVAVERVAENVHYVSDVIAGAALGVLVVRAIVLIGEKLVGAEPGRTRFPEGAAGQHR